MSFFRDFLGTRYGHIFGFRPDELDANNNYTISPQSVHDFFANFAKSKHLNSPHGVWGIMAAIFYFYAAPLDLSPTSAAAQGPITSIFMRERLVPWMLFVLPYVAFWHICLYSTRFFTGGRHPFHDAGAPYRFSKLFHNVFYNVTGIFVYVVLENLMAWLWATGRLGYLSNEQLLAGSGSLKAVYFLIQVSAVPLFRDAHFFYAHQFLHQGIGGTRGLLGNGGRDVSMYQYVHSLHHRNVFIEPFAGLSMHFVEHIYYYACCPLFVFICGPSYVNPYVFIFCAAHMLLAPAASHSGWGGHWQADSFHANHHQKFEVNMAGASAAFLDVLNGSFLGTFVAPKQTAGNDNEENAATNSTKKKTPSASRTKKANSKNQNEDEEGADNDEQSDATLQIHDAKANLLSPISIDQLVYNIVAGLTLIGPLAYLCGWFPERVNRVIDHKIFRSNVELAHAVLPWVFGAGPVVAAFVIYQAAVGGGKAPKPRKNAVQFSLRQDLFNRAMHFLTGPLPLALILIVGFKK